jgi:hypothetical protein
MKGLIQVRAILDIPDRLINDLIKETKAKTKTRAITLATEEHINKNRLLMRRKDQER